MPPLCRETQSLGQQMLNAPVGINGLREADPKLAFIYAYIILKTMILILKIYLKTNIIWLLDMSY